MLEEGVIPPFYLDKIRDDQGTRGVSALNMSILLISQLDFIKFFFKFTQDKPLIVVHILLNITFSILHII